MDTCGVNLLYHTNQLSFLGFWEVLKHLPFIKKVERDLLEQIDMRKPSLAILIDYPGF
ncbi:MAG TPA: lipid-A-disaccharide synthase, partial [candidate division Zixibacteria bacterium]|nr:lipid-A-disaccharide synthase [candidate division Zixibacteria bacterium]